MNRLVTLSCILIISLLMSTIALAHNPTFETFEVGFTPLPGKGILKADTVGNNCKKGVGQQRGCINFPTNSIGTITFALKPKLKQCIDPGVQWVITKVQLSDQGLFMSDGTTPSDKAIFADSPPASTVPDWMKNAFPQVIQASGILYLAADKNDGVTRVERLNLNNNLNASGVKDIWYQVTVSKCGSEEDLILVSDPRLENEGTN